MSDDQIREQVRQRYAEAATAIARGGDDDTGCCGGGEVQAFDIEVRDGAAVFGTDLYAGADTDGAEDALAGSLGCGVPTAVADLHEGETVLDLGSGTGGDVLISARRVGPSGRAIGLDMTDEMLALARANAERAGVTNAEFLHGYLEDVPLPDASVDVVISNCVINLAADKDVVLAEAARVTRPGGRFAVSDVVADDDVDPDSRTDTAQYAGCIVGALTESEYRAALARAGWSDVTVERTHRVADHAAAAVVRAVRA